MEKRMCVLSKIQLVINTKMAFCEPIDHASNFLCQMHLAVILDVYNVTLNFLLPLGLLPLMSVHGAVTEV